MYKVPPRVGLGTRYFADTWNTDSPTATVELVLKANEEFLVLQFLKESQMVAESPPIPLREVNKTKSLDAFVEKVADSSRNFVVPVKEPGGAGRRTLLVGIGFRERQPAFDFLSAVYDRVKLAQRHEQLDKAKALEPKDDDGNADGTPGTDYSLKGRIVVNLKGAGAGAGSGSQGAGAVAGAVGAGALSGGALGFKLEPPPPLVDEESPSLHRKMLGPAAPGGLGFDLSRSAAADDFVDFGAFESAAQGPEPVARSAPAGVGFDLAARAQAPLAPSTPAANANANRKGDDWDDFGSFTSGQSNRVDQI